MNGTSTPGVAEVIRVELARHEMTRQDLAKALGKSPMWITRRLAGTVEPSIDDLVRIADALQIDPSVLFQAAASPTT